MIELVEINTEEEFKQAQETIRMLATEMNKQRCVNCLHHTVRVCSKYGLIPGEHLYSKNDCEDYVDDLPF